MRIILIALVIILGMSEIALAGEKYERQLEQHIERLRLENERLYTENTRLKEALGRRQMNRPYTGTLRQGTQSLRELEQMRRSWDNLRR